MINKKHITYQAYCKYHLQMFLCIVLVIGVVTFKIYDYQKHNYDNTKSLFYSYDDITTLFDKIENLNYLNSKQDQTYFEVEYKHVLRTYYSNDVKELVKEYKRYHNNNVVDNHTIIMVLWLFGISLSVYIIFAIILELTTKIE